MINVKDLGAGQGGDDTAIIQSAHNQSVAVFYPIGTYRVSSIVLPSNAQIIGEACLPAGSYGNCSKLLGTTSAFVFNQDAPLHVGQMLGPRFSDIHIQAANGIRMNDPAKGINQGDIEGCSLRRTSIVNPAGDGTGIGVQLAVPSHFEMDEQCDITGFNVGVDVYDNITPSWIKRSRIWQFGTNAIRVTTNNYRAYFAIENNDLLYGLANSDSFIKSSNWVLMIRGNYMEQTSGEASGLVAAINIVDAVQLLIEDNFITMPGSCAPHWLDATIWPTTRVVKIDGNRVEGSPTPAGPAIFRGNGLSSATAVCPGVNSVNGVKVTFP